MSRYRKITTICGAAVFALGLAACGGGSSGPNADQQAAIEQGEVDSAEVQRLEALIAQLATIAGVEVADVGTGIAALRAEVDRLQALVDAAADKEAADAAKAAAKMGETLFAGFDGDRGSDGTADLAVNVTAVTDSYQGDARITATISAPANSVTAVKATDTMLSLGAWKGTELKGDTNGKVPSSTVHVYTDVQDGKRVAFEKVYTAVTEDGLDLSTTAPTHSQVIASAEFEHTGLKVHGESNTEQDEDIEFRGTFAMAPGKYTCGEGGSSNDCTSNNTSAGVVLSGNWLFVPDVGAMVVQADAGYAYFGWWLIQDSDGYEVDTFQGGTGFTAVDGTTFNALGGSAKYIGEAAGKYAIDPVAPGTTAEGGHWTAKAELDVNFENPAAATQADRIAAAGMISGKIGDFMVGGETRDWTVKFGEIAFGTAGAFDSGIDGGTAVAGDDVTWEIAGEGGGEHGSWSGALRDQDDNNVPKVATGQFTAIYSEDTHRIGRMSGAFGAHLQD